MKIQTMINKVNRYFIDKILSKDFEIINFDTHSAKIKIDQFKFDIWISNKAYGIQCHNDAISESDFNLIFSKDEKIRVYDIIDSMIDLNKLNDDKERTEYERLKKKFEP